MKRPIVLGLAVLMLGSTAAAAFESTSRIDRRQDRQEWRINHGIDNGSLTRREARQLQHSAHQIQRLERMALIDDKLHPAEVGMLNDALDDLSDRIYKAKHNDRYQSGYRHREKKLRHRDKVHYDWYQHSRSPKHGPRDLLAQRD